MQDTMHHKSFLLVKQGFLLAVCIYLCGQAFFPNIERVVPWGEAFCLCLFLACTKNVYVSAFQEKVLWSLHMWMLLVPFYGLWVTLIFWSDEYIPYYLFRSIVPFYYAIFFFGGYKLGPEILDLLNRFKFMVLISVFLLLFQTKSVGIGSTVVVGLVWLGMVYKNKSLRFFWITYCLLILLFLLLGQGGTARIMNAILILLPLMVIVASRFANFKPSSTRRFIFWLVLAMSMCLITYGSWLLLDDMRVFMRLGLTQMEYLPPQGVLETKSEFTDPNALWRLFMWTYVLGQFWVFPQGVGFGTPLFGNDIGAFFGWGTGDFEEMQFALGAHNSFITLLGRLGVVAIVFFFLIGRPFLLCLRQFLQRTKRFSRWDSEFCFVFGSLGVLLIAFVHAFFNMMIETPLYAAHFWFPFGLFVRLCGDYIAKQREKIPVTA